MSTKIAPTPFLILLLAVAMSGCGKKGAPLPPLLRLPAAPDSATAMRVSDEVFLQFTVPTANADGHTPADIGRVEVYAVTSERAPAAEDDPEDLRAVSTLIATEQVRRPVPPPPPVKAGAPPPPAIPLGPGVDQGAVLVIRDTIAADARVLVPLPGSRTPRTPIAEIEPLPGPLVASLDSHEPIRYYYVVGVSPSGRYGPTTAFLPIPLGGTSAAPSAPALAHDATTLTLRWTPSSDARGVTEPPHPDLLPSTPTVPGLPATTYDIYEVPRDAAANQSPSMPAALTPAPLGALELTVPVGAFGVERCFFVRPVDIVNGYHVRGLGSPVACITPKDTFAPGAPKSLAAVASASAVNLIWEPSEEPDLAGYIVLRAEAPGATLTPLTPAPVAETTYADRNVKPGVTYVYAIVAVDKAANRSAESNRVEETARP